MRSRSAIEFQDVVAATYVVGTDLIECDYLSLAEAISNLPAANGTIFILPGTFALPSGGIASAKTGVVIAGSGKESTILTYAGSGTAIAWGTPGSPAVRCFTMSNLSITGTGAGAVGVDFIEFQDFLLVNVRVSGFSAGVGIRISGANSGLSINSDSNNNLVGVDFTTSGGLDPNHNTWIGGHLKGNARAIRVLASATNATFANKFYEVDIFATTTSPAVLVEKGVGWIFEGCFFENNAGGAGTYVITLGSASASCNGALVVGNGFFEPNGITYAVRIIDGEGNKIWGNHNGSVFTAFVRTEAAATKTMIWGNDNPGGATPMLSDASTSVDQFDMGPQTGFNKTPFGYAFGRSLAGQSTPLEFRSISASGNIANLLDSSGVLRGEITPKAGIRLGEAFAAPVTTITFADTGITLSISHYTVLVNASGGAVLVNLPSAATCPGRVYRVKKIDASANAVTIDAAGTEKIDDALTLVIPAQYQEYEIQSDGTNWWIT